MPDPAEYYRGSPSGRDDPSSYSRATATAADQHRGLRTTGAYPFLSGPIHPVVVKTYAPFAPAILLELRRYLFHNLDLRVEEMPDDDALCLLALGNPYCAADNVRRGCFLIEAVDFGFDLVDAHELLQERVRASFLPDLQLTHTSAEILDFHPKSADDEAEEMDENELGRIIQGHFEAQDGRLKHVVQKAKRCALRFEGKELQIWAGSPEECWDVVRTVESLFVGTTEDRQNRLNEVKVRALRRALDQGQMTLGRWMLKARLQY